MRCRKHNIIVKSESICDYFWRDLNMPTTTKRYGCWCCNFRMEE